MNPVIIKWGMAFVSFAPGNKEKNMPNDNINREWYKDYGCNSEQEYYDRRRKEKEEEGRLALRQVFGSQENADAIAETLSRIATEYNK